MWCVDVMWCDVILHVISLVLVLMFVIDVLQSMQLGRRFAMLCGAGCESFQLMSLNSMLPVNIIHHTTYKHIT